MTADDLAALNDQIAAMARAGLPLDQGLDSLAKEMGRGKLRSVTEAIAADLRAGQPLPEALERRKGEVPPYYANLVTAGIQTGRLPEVLTTLTTYARSISATRAAVVEALFYPCVVLVVGFCLFAAMSLFVVPQFEKIFQDFGLKLPAITELVLHLGRHPIELVVIPGLTLFVVLVLARLVIRYTPKGRRIWARAVYFVPLFGTLVRAARLAAFTELLGMLIEYKVPLPTAFRLAGGASSDPQMAARAGAVEERLNQGETLGEAFRGRGLVPEWVAWLASAGEKQGALAPALREIAGIYRRQVETRAAVIRTILPPFIVVMTAGLLTAVFALALMLPMIKLLEGLSQ